MGATTDSLTSPTGATTEAAPRPVIMADILQCLEYRRTYPEFKERLHAEFPAVMSATQSYNMLCFAAANSPQQGRLNEHELAKQSVYRRLVKEARWEYNTDLDEAIFRCVVGDIADACGVAYDDAITMSTDDFALLMDRWDGLIVEGTDGETEEEEMKPPRGRGRRPAAETDPQRVQQDIKLYRDWQGSGLSQKEFLRQRRIPEEEGIRSIDRGDYHAKKQGNNSAE